MFKILSVVLSLLFFFNQVVLADEIQSKSNQAQNIEDNKAVISVQKSPMNETAAQKQTLKNNWFCVVIQINGKVLDNDNN